MARLGRSFPAKTVKYPSYFTPAAPVSCTVTGQAAVLPRIGPTASAGTIVDCIVTGSAAVLPRIGPTAGLVTVSSFTVSGRAAVLPRVGPTGSALIGAPTSRPLTSVGFIPI